MTEATVQQPATTTREQIWLNREQVRKEKPVYRALKRVQDVFFSLLALIVLLPLMLIVALAIVIDDPKGSPIFTQVRSTAPAVGYSGWQHEHRRPASAAAVRSGGVYGLRAPAPVCPSRSDLHLADSAEPQRRDV